MEFLEKSVYDLPAYLESLVGHSVEYKIEV